MKEADIKAEINSILEYHKCDEIKYINNVRDRSKAETFQEVLDRSEPSQKIDVKDEEIILWWQELTVKARVIHSSKHFNTTEASLLKFYQVKCIYEQYHPKQNPNIDTSDEQRELLIGYEIKMRSCSDEEAEIMVDSYLATKHG